MTELPEGVLHASQPLDAPWACVDKDASKRWKLEVRDIDEATFALRQSTRVSPEAPIGYLICGTRRALLLDTGDAKDAAECPMRATVDALLDEWSESHGVARLLLVVAHTHGTTTTPTATPSSSTDRTRQSWTRTSMTCTTSSHCPEPSERQQTSTWATALF